MTRTTVCRYIVIAAGFLFLGMFSYPDIFPGSVFLIWMSLVVIWAVGTFRLFPVKSEIEMILAELGTAESTVLDVIKTGLETVDKMRTGRDKIKNIRVSDKIKRLEKMASDIIKGFADDPGDISRSRDFLTVNLPKTVDAINQYAELESKKDANSIKPVLKEFDHFLDVAEKSFKQRKSKNLENNAQDLSIDLAVLKKKMELNL